MTHHIIHMEDIIKRSNDIWECQLSKITAHEDTFMASILVNDNGTTIPFTLSTCNFFEGQIERLVYFHIPAEGHVIQFSIIG